MNNRTIVNAYERYAPYYDHLFGRILEPGRKAAIKSLNCKTTDRILEVGVGTGISLPLYPSETYVDGIDLCASMLQKAKDRVEQNNLENISLQVMNAELMSFPDNTFDKVAAMYVASVVGKPAKLVSEMKRVCKPGGDLFIVNHFSSDNFFIHGMEKMCSKFSDFLGWDPVFCINTFIKEHRLDVRKITRNGILGYWPLIHANNN